MSFVHNQQMYTPKLSAVICCAACGLGEFDARLSVLLSPGGG